MVIYGAGIMKTTLVIEGELDVDEHTILRFYPEIEGLLREIRGRSWKYSFTHVHGRARVILDLDKLVFRLEYYPPRIEDLEEKGVYEIRAEVGEEPPGILEVRAINEFRLAVSSKHTWRSVEVDPLEKTITYIEDVLWRGIRLDGKKVEKLSEAREVYEIVRFFLNKGYSFKDEYVIERYKELVQLFEKTYTFTITLELTVHDENLVPGWNDLVNQLAEFLYKRGLLMKLKEHDRPFSFRKPIP